MTATGYDPGASVDSSTAELVCNSPDGKFASVPLDGGPPRNYIATLQGNSVLACSAFVGNDLRTRVFAVTDDICIEAWIHPRNNGGTLTYGADPPWAGVGDRCAQCLGFPFSGGPDLVLAFRDAIGIGWYFYWGGVGPFQQSVVTPFPTNMDQWFHCVLNCDRTNGNMYFWLNGQYVGTAAMDNVRVLNDTRVQTSRINDNGGTEPVMGATAFHHRMMTAAEIQAAYRSGTCAVLHVETTQIISTGDSAWSIDFRDATLANLGGVPFPFYWIENLNNEEVDTNLGDAVYSGNPFGPWNSSLVTFYGQGGTPWTVIDKVHPGMIVGHDSGNVRHGWFDGR